MMHGGSGPNTFFDAPGGGLSGFFAGGGDNVLYRAGDTSVTVPPGVTPKSNLSVGLKDGVYSYPAG